MSMGDRYQAVYQRSLTDRDGFWFDAAKGIDWETQPDRVLDDSDPPFYRWFPGGRLNTCYNAVDRHVANGQGGQAAIIHDSPVTGSIERITFADLKDRVALFAGALWREGVEKGDRVILYMPMVPEAVIAMLACARLGAVHSVVFGGFAANELAGRIDDCQPKVIVSASCGIEPARLVDYKPLLDGAIDLAAHKPDRCIILQREAGPAELLPGRDISWDEALAGAEPADPVPVLATDPLYILYTSGTTGRPKGIVRDNGGHAVALHWSMKNIYGVEPGEVYWAASDVGWVVGHSYIVYGPLLHGNTTILYEGKPVGTPDPGAFWRVISEHKVRVMFTAPTALRAIRQQDPEAEYLAQYDMSHFRAQFLAGERCDPETLHWAEKVLKVPVIDHWWQTETGWSIAANCAGIELLTVKAGSSGPAAPGWDIRALGADGHELPHGEIGALCAKLPIPPSTFPTIWGDRERYVKGYLANYPGYYETGDAGLVDEDGFVHVMARTDDVINVAGHRLSTGAMEEVLAALPEVAECAVFGAADSLKGQLPVGLMVLKAGIERPEAEIVSDAVALVRERIGPVAAFKSAGVVKRLPKTRSGKILRGTMRAIADAKDYRQPATIDDPAILDEIKQKLGEMGYAADE